MSRRPSSARRDDLAKNIRSALLDLAFLAFLVILVPLLFAQLRRD